MILAEVSRLVFPAQKVHLYVAQTSSCLKRRQRSYTVTAWSRRAEVDMGDVISTLEQGNLPLSSLEDLARIVQRCRRERKLPFTLGMHIYLMKNGLEGHVSLVHDVVMMLIEVKRAGEAECIFNKFAHDNEILWNCLITAYIDLGEFDHAFFLYQRMKRNSAVHANGDTFVILLKACINLKCMDMGYVVHADIVRTRLLETDIFVGSTLVDMYAKHGLLQEAKKVLYGICQKNVVSWTALVAGYSEHGSDGEAFLCLDLMHQDGVSPGSVTFICIIKACGGMKYLQEGQEMHSYIVKKGIENELIIGSGLIEMYVKCGLLNTAHELFDKLPGKDLVPWNILIAGYANHGYFEESLVCVECMRMKKIIPDTLTFVSILKAYGCMERLCGGQEAHIEIMKMGLEKHIFIRCTLINMYARLNFFTEAQQVFDEPPAQGIVAWNALISGYVDHGLHEKASFCFKQMHLKRIPPDSITFSCMLKVCSSLGLVDLTCEIHGDICKRQFEAHLVLGNSMVDTYSKLGLIFEAQHVFDKLLARNTVSWNALIIGYAECGYSDKALQCLEQMHIQGVSPNVATFTCIMKACVNIETIWLGYKIHSDITKFGFMDQDDCIGTTLMDMYVKCGSISEVRSVFDRLVSRDVVSWTLLLSAYAAHSEAEIGFFDQMQRDGILPVSLTFIFFLQMCDFQEIAYQCQLQGVHTDIVKRGIDKDDHLSSTLIDMYGKCGLIQEAYETLEKMELLDTVSATALIMGYVEHGYGVEALQWFEWMKQNGIPWGALTLLCWLKACSMQIFLGKGQEIHCEIVKLGFESDPFISAALLDMYGRFGLSDVVGTIFGKLIVRNTGSYNALILGNTLQGHGSTAIGYIEKMRYEGICPDASTYVSILKACSATKDIHKGIEIHADTVKRGLLELDTILQSNLVGMYARSRRLPEALKVFNDLRSRDVVTWVALLAGYAENDDVELVLQCFDQMRIKGVSPCAMTFTCCLKACASRGFLIRGQEIHVDIIKHGLENDVTVNIALTDMYISFTMFKEGRKVSDKLKAQDLSWRAAVIEGCANFDYGGTRHSVLNGMPEISRMYHLPSLIEYIHRLKICGTEGSHDGGCKLYAETVIRGLETNTYLGSALVNMYAKYGMLVEARKVFGMLSSSDVVARTALVTGYSQLGESRTVFSILNAMEEDGVRPNLITCLAVLNVCSHAGLVDNAIMFFKAMSCEHGCIPAVEHHTSLVDVLGRAGHLEKVVMMCLSMPFHLNNEVLHVMFRDCWKCRTKEFGDHVFSHVLQSGNIDTASYVCMANICVNSDILDEMEP